MNTNILIKVLLANVNGCDFPIVFLNIKVKQLNKCPNE